MTAEIISKLKLCPHMLAGSTGVSGGSAAAAWQASIGNVAAASPFASLQSIGAAGIGVAVPAVAGAGVGVLTAAGMAAHYHRQAIMRASSIGMLAAGSPFAFLQSFGAAGIGAAVPTVAGTGVLTAAGMAAHYYRHAILCASAALQLPAVRPMRLKAAAYRRG
jgi:hypothetical protein